MARGKAGQDRGQRKDGMAILLVQLMMRFEEKGEGTAACSQAQRTLDVILLRDNRHSIRSPDFRSSAFKETEADPLDEHSELPNPVEQLLLRVAQLEQRVQVLEEHRESLAQPTSGRKRRRRFEEMQRDIECPTCQKSYGSETALKYHFKLKHGGQPQ